MLLTKISDSIMLQFIGLIIFVSSRFFSLSCQRGIMYKYNPCLHKIQIQLALQMVTWQIIFFLLMYTYKSVFILLVTHLFSAVCLALYSSLRHSSTLGQGCKRISLSQIMFYMCINVCIANMILYMERHALTVLDQTDQIFCIYFIT